MTLFLKIFTFPFQNADGYKKTTAKYPTSSDFTGQEDCNHPP